MTNNNHDEDNEHYPRHRRAPYLHCDAIDLGTMMMIVQQQQQQRTARGSSDVGISFLDHHGDENGGSGGDDDNNVTEVTSNYFGGGSNNNQTPLRRTSNPLARMFSTFGISPGPTTTIVEDVATTNTIDHQPPTTLSPMKRGGGPDESGGDGGLLTTTQLWRQTTGQSTTDLLTTTSSNSITSFKRLLSSDESKQQQQQQQQQYRDRSGSNVSRDSSGGGNNATTNATATDTNCKIPRWALNDPSSTIVMKDGHPVLVSTLIQHYSLLRYNNNNNYNYNYNNNNNLARTTPTPPYTVIPTWRLKERMKTVGACLVLALNIGTDPPDLLNKPNPCATLQTWLDTTLISRAKARERVGERLEQQYARWQQRSRLRYRRALDPTAETVRELCIRTREVAKAERVLLHYNGHGVPRPTTNGEIWLFDKHHTNYIPLSVTDLRYAIGKPSIVVLDCSGAGVLLPFFAVPLDGNSNNNGGTTADMNTTTTTTTTTTAAANTNINSGPEYLRAIRDTIVLCPMAQGDRGDYPLIIK